jgi:hypothetical protein
MGQLRFAAAVALAVAVSLCAGPPMAWAQTKVQGKAQSRMQQLQQHRAACMLHAAVSIKALGGCWCEAVNRGDVSACMSKALTYDKMADEACGFDRGMGNADIACQARKAQVLGCFDLVERAGAVAEEHLPLWEQAFRYCHVPDWTVVKPENIAKYPGLLFPSFDECMNFIQPMLIAGHEKYWSAQEDILRAACEAQKDYVSAQCGDRVQWTSLLPGAKRATASWRDRPLTRLACAAPRAGTVAR